MIEWNVETIGSKNSAPKFAWEYERTSVSIDLATPA